MSKNGRQIILDKVKSSKFRNAIVKVTKRCNLNCKYCYIEHKNQDLPINLLKIFLKQAIPLGLKQIYFHGGEPLLMPISYYKEIANFLKKNYPDENIKMDLVTNGTLIIKEIIEEFKKMGIGIGVSVITKNTINLAKPEEFLDFFVRNKIKGISLNLCGLAGRNANKKLATTNKEYSNFLKKIFDEWLKINDKSLIIREFENIVRVLITGQPPIGCTLAGGLYCSHMCLEPEGNIYPCDWFMEDKFSGGNIKNKELPSIVKEAKMKFYNLVYKDFIKFKEKNCLKCKWCLLCRGGCSMFIYNKTYSFCKAFKPVYKYIADRLDELGYDLKYFDLLKKVKNKRTHLLI